MTRRRISIRMAIGIAALAALTGCQTLGGVSVRNIETIPSGALVTIPGYGECITPCSVALDEPRPATIAKAGYLKEEVVLEPGRGDMVFELSLAAPTADIDQETLPELD